MIDLFLNNPQRSYRIDERIISKTGDDYEVLDRIGNWMWRKWSSIRMH
jgi:hypothetical protein